MRVLYINDNEYERQSYTVYLENILDNIEVFDEANTDQALSKLKKIPNLALILCTNLKDGRLHEVYDFAKQNLPQTPFVLLGPEDPDSLPALMGFKSHNDKNGNIKLPISPVDFREAILNILCPSRFSTTTLSPILAFKKVRLFHFYRFNKVLCNVYIKLSDRKYVKIFNQNIVYSRLDLDKLVEKSVEFLFIRNDDFDKFHVSFSKTPFLSHTNENKGPEEIAEVLEVTHKTMQKMMINLGFTKDVIDLAEKNVTQIIKTTESSPSLFEIIRSLRTEMNYIYDHSYLLAITGCEILKQMKWQNDEKIKNFCMAAIFHDVTVTNPEMAMIQDQTDPKLQHYTSEEIKAYLSHPFDAANLLSACDFVDPEVLDMIRQHHENQEGQGFPNKLHPSKLSPLVCTFILAHEFVAEIYKNDFEPSTKDKTIQALITKYKKGNFKAPLMAFSAKHLSNQVTFH